MGYACPVCEAPQRDGEHLANHLAFTAMLRNDEHETWLDEYAPGWGEERPADLADRVTPHATETEYDEVFEDTAHGGSDRPAGGRGPAGAGGAGGFEGTAQGIADDAVESVLREAEEMTEEMYGLDGSGTEGSETDGDGSAGDADGE